MMLVLSPQMALRFFIYSSGLIILHMLVFPKITPSAQIFLKRRHTRLWWRHIYVGVLRHDKVNVFKTSLSPTSLISMKGTTIHPVAKANTWISP